MPVPINRIWRRMFAMFSRVQAPGSTPRSMAAFSAGSPKASKPIGWTTL